MDNEKIIKIYSLKELRKYIKSKKFSIIFIEYFRGYGKELNFVECFDIEIHAIERKTNLYYKINFVVYEWNKYSFNEIVEKSKAILLEKGNIAYIVEGISYGFLINRNKVLNVKLCSENTEEDNLFMIEISLDHNLKKRFKLTNKIAEVLKEFPNIEPELKVLLELN